MQQSIWWDQANKCYHLAIVSIGRKRTSIRMHCKAPTPRRLELIHESIHTELPFCKVCEEERARLAAFWKAMLRHDERYGV
jgi:hypothetical protein